MLKQKSKKSISPSLKGSVLFTVLVVSTILLIMMLTTITLAGVASKRAYNEYNDHQTITTARSVVDSVITSLKKDKDFGGKIVTDLKASKSFVDVEVNGGNNLGEGFGTVDNLRFEYVGLDNNTGYNITGSGKPIIKITATVTQSGITSSYSQYVIGDAGKNGYQSSGGGFVAFGGFESSSSSTNPNVYAPAYIGIDKTTVNFDETVKLHNDTSNRASIINSNLLSNANANFILEKNEGPSGQNGGVTVTGNFVCDNPFTIEGCTPSSTYSTENMSYLYVGGTLDIYNAASIGTKDHPINIFCGRLVYERSSCEMNANVFCYNNGADSRESVDSVSLDGEGFKNLAGKDAYAKKSWSYIGTTKSSLINWAENVTTPSTNDKTYTGSFCTKGSLSFEGQAQIDGDVYVEKDLYIAQCVNENSIKIKGNVYVNGSLTAKDNNKDIASKFLKGVTGTVYCNKAFLDIPADPTDDFTKLKKNKTALYSTSTMNTVCKKFLSGGMFESISSLENDVIVTPANAKKGFTETVTEQDESGNDVDVEHYKDVRNYSQIKLNTSRVLFQDGTDIKSVDYDATGKSDHAEPETKSAGYDAVITGGCTLTGSMDNVKLFFKPSTDIWVNLYNLKLSNDCQFIIDDSAGKVNFFMIDLDKKNYAGTQDGTNKYKWVHEECKAYEELLKSIAGSPSGGYANTFEISKLELMTLKYKEAFEAGGEINLVTNPTGANAWMVPGIGLYAGEDSKTSITVTNPTTFTCDVYMPAGTYSAKVSGSDIVKKSLIKWNGTVIKPANNCNMQLIGSLMVGTIHELQNDYTLAFVNDGTGSGPSITSGENYEWNPVNGLADF